MQISTVENQTMSETVNGLDCCGELDCNKECQKLMFQHRKSDRLQQVLCGDSGIWQNQSLSDSMRQHQQMKPDQQKSSYDHIKQSNSQINQSKNDEGEEEIEVQEEDLSHILSNTFQLQNFSQYCQLYEIQHPSKFFLLNKEQEYNWNLASSELQEVDIKVFQANQGETHDFNSNHYSYSPHKQNTVSIQCKQSNVQSKTTLKPSFSRLSIIKSNEQNTQDNNKQAYLEKRNVRKNNFVPQAKLVVKSISKALVNIERKRQSFGWAVGVYSLATKFIKKLKQSIGYTKIEDLTEYQLSLISDLSHFREEQQPNRFSKYSFIDFLLRFYNICLSLIPVFIQTNLFKHLWDMFQTLNFYVFSLIFSILLFFNPKGEDQNFLQIYSCFTLFITFFDMLIIMNTAINNQGCIILDRIRILKNYLFSLYFLADLISFLVLFSKTLIKLDSLTYNPQQNIWKFCYSSLIFTKAFGNFFKSNGQEYLYFMFSNKQRQCFQMIQFIFLVISIAHIGSIGWYLVGHINQMYNPDEKSWLDVYNMANLHFIQKYITSLYWAISAMSIVGQRNISVANSKEELYQIFTTLIFSLFFAYSVFKIKDIFYEENNSSSPSQNRKLETIQKYLQNKRVNVHLMNRVWYQIKFLEQDEYTKRNTIKKQVESNALQSLPQSMQEEITIEINTLVLKQFSIFSRFSEQTRRKLLFKIEEIIVQPNEVIFQEGDFNDKSIYLIQSGLIQIYVQQFSPTGNTLKGIQNLSNNQIFGEYSFLSNFPRTASARSLQVTQLYKIKRQDFMSIICNCQEDLEIFKTVEHTLSFEQKNSHSYILSQFKCYSCREQGHMARYCPRIHQQFNSQIISLKHNFPIFQERFKAERKKNRSISAIKKVKENEEISSKLQKKQLLEYTYLLSQDDIIESKRDKKTPKRFLKQCKAEKNLNLYNSQSTHPTICVNNNTNKDMKNSSKNNSKDLDSQQNQNSILRNCLTNSKIIKEIEGSSQSQTSSPSEKADKYKSRDRIYDAQKSYQSQEEYQVQQSIPLQKELSLQQYQQQLLSKSDENSPELQLYKEVINDSMNLEENDLEHSNEKNIEEQTSQKESMSKVESLSSREEDIILRVTKSSFLKTNQQTTYQDQGMESINISENLKLNQELSNSNTISNKQNLQSSDKQQSQQNKKKHNKNRDSMDIKLLSLEPKQLLQLINYYFIKQKLDLILNKQNQQPMQVSRSSLLRKLSELNLITNEFPLQIFSKPNKDLNQKLLNYPICYPLEVIEQIKHQAQKLEKIISLDDQLNQKGARIYNQYDFYQQPMSLFYNFETLQTFKYFFPESNYKNVIQEYTQVQIRKRFSQNNNFKGQKRLIMQQRNSQNLQNKDHTSYKIKNQNQGVKNCQYPSALSYGYIQKENTLNNLIISPSTNKLNIKSSII